MAHFTSGRGILHADLTHLLPIFRQVLAAWLGFTLHRVCCKPKLFFLSRPSSCPWCLLIRCASENTLTLFRHQTIFSRTSSIESPPSDFSDSRLSRPHTVERVLLLPCGFLDKCHFCHTGVETVASYRSNVQGSITNHSLIPGNTARGQRGARHVPRALLGFSCRKERACSNKGITTTPLHRYTERATAHFIPYRTARCLLLSAAQPTTATS